MALQDLSQMIESAVEKLKTMLETDSVIGEPTNTEGVTLIPVSKISFGFVTGGFDMKNRSKFDNGTKEEPIAVLGGGATVQPEGFIIISDGDTSYISAKQDDVKGKSWFSLIQDIVSKSKKKI
jgi:uncharacterized spore protein YtfJ